VNAPSPDDWNAHWSSYAQSNTVNPAQAYRRRLIFAALDAEAARGPVRLLELGSGQGDLARELRALLPRADLVGLELSREGVEQARRKVPGAEFFEQDLTQTLRVPGRYLGWATHAVCSEVLEHVDDPVALLANAKALMAPGCRLVVTVPGGPVSAFDRHIGHRRHFSAARLSRVLSDAGYEPAEVHGAGFPFFNLYRLMVVARGRRLIDDVKDDGSRPLPLSARLAMRAFSTLFRVNLTATPWGWQRIAVATPASTTGSPIPPEVGGKR
jgi:SAM-dependent methyltransferase